MQAEAQPTRSPRVELELQGVSLRLDAFPPGGAHVRRTTLSIASLEIRDCRPAPDTPPAWRRLLSQSMSHTIPQNASACLLEVHQHAPRPPSSALRCACMRCAT